MRDHPLLLNMTYVHQRGAIKLGTRRLLAEAQSLGLKWLVLVCNAQANPREVLETLVACSLPGVSSCLSCSEELLCCGQLTAHLRKADWQVEVRYGPGFGSPDRGSVPPAPGLEKTANLRVSAEDIACLGRTVPHLLSVFDRVKLSFEWSQRREVLYYFEFASAIQRLHEQFPGRVLALIPWVLLKPANLAIARSVCDYRSSIGLTTDGEITVCGLPHLPVGKNPHMSVQQAVTATPLLTQLRSVHPSHIDAPCSVCLFRDCCANQCPARVYAQSGSFSASLPECRILYEEGRFPPEYVVRDAV